MEIIYRAIAVYVFLWVMTRALGKRELTEMTAFELLLLVVLGDIVQQGVTQEDMSITGAVLAAGTMGLLALGTSYVSFKSKKARRVLEGVPIIIVRDGKIISEALRIERLTEDEIIQEVRMNGISSMDEVKLGVLEPDGKFSFLKRN